MDDECPEVLLCPTCNPMAGCQPIGCPCLNGNVLYRPARNPPNLPRPPCCPKCETMCFRSAFECPPLTCCSGKEKNYVADPCFEMYTY